MSLVRLWGALAVVLPVLGALIANLSSVDLAYQLRAGSQILDGQGIPRIDTWTYTAAGAPWIDQQWGAQAVLAAVYRVAGWSGLVVLRAGLIGVLAGLVFLCCRLRGLDIRRAAWLTLAAFVVSAAALALRPQLFGMVLLAATLALLAARRRWPRVLWLIPVIVVVWANLHGSFFLGPLVVGLAWLEDRRDRVPGSRWTLAVAALSAAAAFINPFGMDVWRYALGLSTNPQVRERITEWQPTTLRTVPGILFYASALAVAAIVARRRASVGWPALVWLAAFFVVGIFAIRGVAWWPLGAIYAIAPLVGRMDPSRRSLPGPAAMRLNAAILAALAVAGVALLPVWRPVDSGLGAPAGVVGDAPSGVTAALRKIARPDDRLFNPQPWGSWFEFALPDVPVAIDSRIELFSTAVWDEYDAVRGGTPGWEQILDGRGVTIVVVRSDDTEFAQRVRGAGWRTAFEDESGIVFVEATRNST